MAGLVEQAVCRTVAQCPFGSITVKPTDLLGVVSTLGMPSSCPHRRQMWRIPWSGARRFAAHPELRGTQLAIPIADWREDMRRSSPPSGPFVSKVAAHYPSLFNAELVMRFIVAWHLSAASSNRETASPGCGSLVRVGRWRNALVSNPRSPIPLVPRKGGSL